MQRIITSFQFPVSALGYEKCFVSKGYYNIQTNLPFLKWNKLFLDLALPASRRLQLQHVFSARFPRVVRASGKAGIRNRNGNGNRKRNRNRNRKRQRNRDINVKGNQYKNRDIITLYYFNSDSIDTKKKKTSLLSCSLLTHFTLRLREGKKSSK